MDEARHDRQGVWGNGAERRGADRRQGDRRHDPSMGGRRHDSDRRRRIRRAKMVGAGALAGLAFTLGARQFASSARPPWSIEATDTLGEDGEGSVETEATDFRVPWTRETLEPIIQEAAAMYGLQPELIRAVIQTESRFDPAARSRVGAQGLMQLMPHTARHLGVEDPFDPRQNVLAGTKYLRTLLQRFGGNTAKALAAYNAGPTVVARHRGVPPYRETQGYVRKIHKLVEDTDAEFALPARKARRASLRRGTRQVHLRKASSRRGARKATVRKASARSARKATVGKGSRRTRKATVQRTSARSRRASARRAATRRVSARRGD